MIEELFEKFDGAFAPNTIRAYRSDYKDYQSWCSDNDVEPLNCHEEEMARYITDISASKSSATIRRRLDSLSSIFRLSNSQNPCTKPEVILALKRIYRLKGRHQHQATPLTKDVLEKLLSICTDDIRGIRDQVLLKLGYETMRRRSELCEFKFTDIKKQPNGKTALHLRFSKADQFGHGKLIPISNDLYRLLDRWQLLVGDDKHILRGVYKNQSISTSFTPASLTRRLKELQHGANLDIQDELSGHSFRVGAALDMLTAGSSFEQIMLKGGWKSESTVIRYLRSWNEL